MAADRHTTGQPSAGAATTGPASTLLTVSDAARAFGETRALVAANLVIQRREIHALVGENGSGKTTLIKILSGVLRPDAGTYRWEGRQLAFGRPRTAMDSGIATVFQETLVALEMSVRDNVFAGLDGVFRRDRSRSAEDAACRGILAALGPDIDLDRPLWSLTLAERQLVTIARAAVRPWQLLILDEGTSALDANQRDRLFAYLHQQCDEAKAVLFTSHRMDEVAALADSVTVLRLGSTVMQSAIRDTSSRQILAAMANREEVQAIASRETRSSHDRTGVDPLVRVTELPARDASQPDSVAVARGEILGLAGLEGHGQVEFAELLCGMPGRWRASVAIADEGGGHAWSPIRRPIDAQRHGVAYVPRDRKQDGLFFPLSILDNFSLAMLRDHTRWGVIRRSAILDRFLREAERLRLPADRWREPIGVLSGGNQQKVLLGRWVATEPRLLVLNDPLRGVDANTKEDLYQVFRELADGGMSIVLVSTDILELLTLCDRIAVFHRGTVACVLDGPTTTDRQVVAAMFGASEHAAEGAA